MARGARPALGRLSAVAAIVCAAATCESKTGPNDPIAIEFNGSQLPSLVKGDQLRDTLGNVDSLLATVFNSSGDTIHGATVRYVHADTTTIVTIDSVTGHVTATDTGFARVVAQAGALQSNPETLFVVEPPTQLTNVTALDDTLDFTPIRADTLLPLSVLLKSGADSVNHYRVEYRFAYPADLNTPDSSRVLLTDENRNFSLVDTTATSTTAVTAGNGIATRYLRISAFAHSGFSDTVVVEARSFLPDHTPVPGTPVRFTVHVQIH
jgi:YbbR domain-containing protein